MRNIKQGLEAISVGMQSQVPTETLQAFGASIADLQLKEFGKNSQEGMLFPSTVVINEEGKEVSIVDKYRGKKVLVSFVRGSWCPFCTVEIAHLISYYEELQEMGIEVIVVSPMQIEALKQWKDEMQMPFTVVQDRSLILSKALGIDFELQDFVQPHYEALGLDLKVINHTDIAELALPAVYVVDENGIIIFRYMDVNYSERLDLQEVMIKL